MYFFYILGVLTATFLIPVDGACNDVAIAFLSAFYHGTGGPNWSDNTNWMDYTQNPCDTKDNWYKLTPVSGVTIGKLDVNTINLVGTIPTEIGTMSLLSEFKMIENSLTGPIPSEFGRLTLVDKFKLTDNLLTGTLPSELGLMTYMNEFKIENNLFSGLVPSQLAGFSVVNTAKFLMTGIDFCGTVPQEVLDLNADVDATNPCPTPQPTPQPTSLPTREPSPLPTPRPTRRPTPLPTPRPTLKPSPLPTLFPTYPPTRLPTYSPTLPPTPVPTEPPTLVPTPLPTEPPTLFPTPSPSPKPTLVPSVTHYPTTSTGKPSSLPTVRPSIVPTSVPTTIPTPLPTLTPTSAPTTLPTTSPTFSLHPSSLPTIEPTQVPTPAPTLTCPNGSVYSVDDNSCEVCGIGYYSNPSEAIPRPTQCNQCVLGKYSITLGATSCLTCDVGKLSSADRASCKDCAAGEYNNNGTVCTKCERGKYAPTAQDGACIQCNAGDYTNNGTGATTCSSCDAGTYSRNLATECIDCPIGTSSLSRAGNCTKCVPGKYNNETAAGSCTSCDAGTYAADDGSYKCDACPAGTNQPSTGQFLCLDCAGGKYADSTQSLGCTTCANGYDSPDGSSSCDIAASEFFLLPNSDGTQSTTASACPDFMTCDGGDHGPAPDKGYWVDRSSYEFVKDVYVCPRKTCIGSKSSDSCWNYANYTAETGACEQDTLLCDEGSKGPLCGSCDTNYIFKPISRTCEACSQAVELTYITAMVGGSVLTMAILLFALGARQEHSEHKRLEREAGTRHHSETHPSHIKAVVYKLNNHIYTLLFFFFFFAFFFLLFFMHTY